LNSLSTVSIPKMAVVVETTLGDFTIDLFTEERPRSSLNFLKLCKNKFYNNQLIFSVQRNFVAQTGDPTNTGRGGESIFKEMFGEKAKYYEGEKLPELKHGSMGTVSMVAYGNNLYGSQFIITLGDDLASLDSEHLVIGTVTEGQDAVARFNDVLCDDAHRPYQDVRVCHTVILHDPFPDPEEIAFPSRSPRVTAEALASDYLAVYESVEDGAGRDEAELAEEIAAKEAQARATILEMVGDLPDADVAPPENVLFVCKLNPVTTSEDLEIIFARFGQVNCAEVIKDRITGNSLQYAFVEFDDKAACEKAYYKMDNVLIDDRRIHVDFSQSVSQYRWRGKGRGAEEFDKKGNRVGGDRKPEVRKRELPDPKNPKSRFIDTEAYAKRYREDKSKSDGDRRYERDRDAGRRKDHKQERIPDRHNDRDNNSGRPNAERFDRDQDSHRRHHGRDTDVERSSRNDGRHTSRQEVERERPRRETSPRRDANGRRDRSEYGEERGKDGYADGRKNDRFGDEIRSGNDREVRKMDIDMDERRQNSYRGERRRDDERRGVERSGRELSGRPSKVPDVDYEKKRSRNRHSLGSESKSNDVMKKPNKRHDSDSDETEKVRSSVKSKDNNENSCSESSSDEDNKRRKKKKKKSKKHRKSCYSSDSESSSESSDDSKKKSKKSKKHKKSAKKRKNSSDSEVEEAKGKKKKSRR